MSIEIQRAGSAARVQAAVAFALWCAGVAVGCAVGFEVDGPTDPPPFSSENPTGFGTPSCVPYTCEYLDRELREIGSIGIGCGAPGDGCGGPPIDCGSCAPGFRCEILSDPAGSRCVEERDTSDQSSASSLAPELEVERSRRR